jgi:hypothetical protein
MEKRVVAGNDLKQPADISPLGAEFAPEQGLLPNGDSEADDQQEAV